MKLGVTKDARVIPSQISQVQGSKAIAELIFGEGKVEFVKGSSGGNTSDNNGNVTRK